MNRLKPFAVIGSVTLLTAICSLAGDDRAAVQTDTNAAGMATSGVVTQGLRVFTCGHSFHVFVPIYLQQLADKAGLKGHETVGVSYIGGSRVVEHWDVPDEKNEAKAALRAGRVDVLTLSPKEEPDVGINNFAYLGLKYNPNIRITVQESWLAADNAVGDWNAATIGHLRVIHQPYIKAMDQYVSNFNKNLRKPVLFVVPAAQAAIALRAKIVAGEAPGLRLQSDIFADTRGHAKPPLTALVSYCHFAVIYRRSPVGLPIPTELGDNGYRNEDLNRLLQQLAWDAVIHHPLSGVKDVAASAQETATGAATAHP
jgi:hypothetical protein